MTEFDVRRLIALIATESPEAVVAVRELGRKLLRLADTLEAKQADPYKVSGGMSERVKMTVVGPDGGAKQSVDVTNP